MSLHADLLHQARHLATREPRRPKEASLRRAVSAAYYALFHLLVNEASLRFVGGRRDRRNLRECLVRAFAHRDMKQASQGFAGGKLSPKLAPAIVGHAVQIPLAHVAETFVELQQARHEADYDTAKRFTRLETLNLVNQAEQAFTDW